MEAEETLAQLAGNQWGVFSREQARAAGLSVWAIQRRLSSGDWVEVCRRVYRHRGGHDSWHQAVRAATLSLGPAAMASHRTAGFLWGLDGLGMGAPATIDVTVPRSVAASVPGVAIHHTVHVPRGPGARQRLPVTPLARTLLDLAASLDERATELALDSAIRQYPATLIGVGYELRELKPGHPGCAALGRLAEHRRLGFTDSALEADANRMIRLFGLPLPVTRYVVRDLRGAFIARVDFAWPDFRVVVFADSRRWHLSASAFEKDLKQRNALEALGWRVLHVTRKMFESGSWLVTLQTVLEAQRALPAQGPRGDL